jgi:hypothetical protein
MKLSVLAVAGAVIATVGAAVVVKSRRRSAVSSRLGRLRTSVARRRSAILG